MKIRIDTDACQGHGRCYDLAPALFEADDEGFPVLLTDGAVAADQQDEARLAVESCPELAISIDD